MNTPLHSKHFVSASIILSSVFSSACAQQPQHTQQVSSQSPSVGLAAQCTTYPALPSHLSIFGENIPLDQADVRESAEREWYATLQQSGQLILDLKRASRFFPQFSKIFEEEKVPDDVKYLAIAESALYQVRSPKDAMGIWQFIEGTAKQYGLEVDDYVDERRDVVKSTHAAAEFLSEAHTRFGSWCLAAAAYNMGMEGVRAAIAQQEQSNYFSLYFNEETSRYIYRIAVIKELLEHPSQYGLILPNSELYAPEQTTTERVYTGIEKLTVWAASKGMTYKDLKLLNPWILRSSLPKSKNGFWDITLRK